MGPGGSRKGETWPAFQNGHLISSLCSPELSFAKSSKQQVCFSRWPRPPYQGHRALGAAV